MQIYPATKNIRENGVRLDFLDWIRGLAVASVFLFHCLRPVLGVNQMPWGSGFFRDFSAAPQLIPFFPLTYGSYGVAAFFVVSGFCVHLSFRRQPATRRWSVFACKRFYRIFPPYWLALAFFWLLPPLCATPDPSGWLYDGASHFFCLHNLSTPSYAAINPSFWSIAVEVQLYMIYPILFLVGSSLGFRRAFLLAAVCEFVIRGTEAILSATGQDGMPICVTMSPFAYWGSWAIGTALAEEFLTHGNTSHWSRLLKNTRLDVVAALALLSPLTKVSLPFAFPLFALTTAIAIDRLLWDLALSSRCFGFLSKLGVISYSIYLIHQP
jgi:peptidoglycan/LPS O-acetylase OafA/YrhL